MITLRPGQPLDAGALGRMITDAVLALSWKPRLHSAAEDIGFAGRMIDRGWVTVAEHAGRTSGFIAREGAEIHALFVSPDAQGQGIGSALIGQAQGQCAQLKLWTFEANSGAQRLYRRLGFEVAGRGDGQANDEGLPDIRMAWQATVGMETRT